MSNISKCQDELLKLADSQGYLTFDNIINASESFSLSVPEVDFLSEAIQLRGILVYETEPQTQSSQDEDEIFDYSRIDYDAIYTEILLLAPQLKTLIEEIKNYPTPQYGEINILAMQIAEGNQYARQRLIVIYMRTVLKIALSMTKQYELDLEEAISAGFIGLMNAVDRYDPSGFSVFHSYASLWIQQGIQRECAPLWIDFYFPVNYKERMLRVLQKYNRYSSGEEVGSQQYCNIVARIAEETDLSENEVEKALRRVFAQKYGKISIDYFLEMENENEALLPDALIATEDEAYGEIYQKQLEAVIEKLLSSLSDKEANIIRMRNGFESIKPMTLEEIGAELCVTRERVRQIEAKAMKKLTHPTRSRIIKDYI